MGRHWAPLPPVVVLLDGGARGRLDLLLLGLLRCPRWQEGLLCLMTGPEALVRVVLSWAAVHLLCLQSEHRH
ncbi:hypothetical protein VZT92_022997 [Zoarces viviparus]|uniref:Secreted protein n=1 Tax=Zoarces viviparus TaxID=48416 RepID=A0AAW1E593_ZOAVI